jgi:hypothetical protein
MGVGLFTRIGAVVDIAATVMGDENWSLRTENARQMELIARAAKQHGNKETGAMSRRWYVNGTFRLGTSRGNWKQLLKSKTAR